MSNGTQYTITPMVPGVRAQDPPDYDGVTFVYVFTNILDPWVMPPVQGNVTVIVANAQGLVPGMTIVVENAGYFEVVSTGALNQLTMMNFGTNYNQPPGTGIAPGKVTTTSLPGPPGGIGPQGPQGVQGVQGPLGPPLNPKGTVANSSLLPATGNSEGDLWTTTDTGHAWSWTGNAWIDLGPFQGPTGPTGPQGSTGPQGVQGATGPAGNQGPIGPTGSQGPIGNTGPTGPAGTPGATGSTGPQGTQGPAGPTGATGSIGPQGPSGPAGPPGGASAYTTLASTFTMPAVNATAVASVAAGGAAQFNVGGIVYISPIGYLDVTAVNTGANTLTLQNLGYSVNQAPGSTAPSGNTLTGVGPQGPAGPAGPQGSQGTQGPQGTTGATGSQGPAGATGPTGATGNTGPAGQAATVAVGTTTTGAGGSNAAVTNSGTSSAAVLNFTVPQGIQGTAGAQGPTGSQGPTGATGATGQTGSQGAQGPQGNPGATGATGPTGASGLNAFNITSGPFTVPPVGQTVNVTLTDASWVVVGQFVYVDQAAGGPGQAGILQVTGKTGNQITLLNPTTPPVIPLASSSQQGLMSQLSGNTTDFVDGTNNCQNLANAIQPTIWAMRLRSFNAVGNPNFEADHANVGGTLTNPANNVRISDRWFVSKSATLTAVVATVDQPTVSIKIPGTNFVISRSQQLVSVSTAQATLAAGDYWMFLQNVEGPQWRELSGDVHSVSVLVYSSIAPLTFAVKISDSPVTKSLVNLLTVSVANTWTLLTLPTLPAFPSGNFTISPGVTGYQIGICLACGTTYQAPATGTWQTGNFLGAAGMTNFLASGNFLYCAFVQHEPGPLCTTLIDNPFTQNLDECLRYYDKSYAYAAAPGTISNNGFQMVYNVVAGVNTTPNTSTRFAKRMAKVPTVTIYNRITGAANSIDAGGTNYPVSSVPNVNEISIPQIALSTGLPANTAGYFHYVADTGW